jgi:hypothetical protein
MTAVEVQATDPENWPTRDTGPLHKRIEALDEEQQHGLRETWVANGLGGIDPLVTNEQLRLMERLIANVEHSITGTETWERANNLKLAVDGLPGNIAEACREGLRDYAGFVLPIDGEPPLVTTAGRLLEAERIVAEAIDYAREITQAMALHPSSLPPIDEPTQAEVAATFTDYPGPKAKADEVLAWVGDDKNRAARAFAAEHTDRKPRKGVVDKLRGILGIEGVAKVREAMEAAEPPPLDLTSAPSLSADVNAGEPGGPPAPGAGADAVAAAEDESVEAPPSPDVKPPAPEDFPNVISPAARRAALYQTIADAFAELAVTG